jgi:hypothetical protein
LVTRHKHSWVRDAELVELYEHQLQPSPKWPSHFRQNPFPFHVRYFWSRNTGGIRHIDATPVAEQHLPFERGTEPTRTVGPTLRSRTKAMVLNKIFQLSRRREIDIPELLRCMSCHQSGLTRLDDCLVCGRCGRRFVAEPIPQMFPDATS